MGTVLWRRCMRNTGSDQRGFVSWCRQLWSEPVWINHATFFLEASLLSLLCWKIWKDSKSAVSWKCRKCRNASPLVRCPTRWRPGLDGLDIPICFGLDCFGRRQVARIALHLAPWSFQVISCLSVCTFENKIDSWHKLNDAKCNFASFGHLPAFKIRFAAHVRPPGSRGTTPAESSKLVWKHIIIQYKLRCTYFIPHWCSGQVYSGVVMVSTRPPEKSQRQQPAVSKHVVFDSDRSMERHVFGVFVTWHVYTPFERLFKRSPVLHGTMSFRRRDDWFVTFVLSFFCTQSKRDSWDFLRHLETCCLRANPATKHPAEGRWHQLAKFWWADKMFGEMNVSAD